MPDVAHVVVAVAVGRHLVEPAEVEVVLAARLVPEGDVERVERAGDRELPALTEMDAVRRKEAPESAAVRADALVALARRTGRVRVLEYHEVVPGLAEGTTVENAVVVLRSPERDDAEVRLDPREAAVAALGVADAHAVGGELLAHGLPAAADGDAVVVHPQEVAALVAVGHDAVVVAPVALPWLLVRHRHAHVLWLVHDARRGGFLRVHHMVVPQHLKAAPDVKRCADGDLRRHNQHNAQYKSASCQRHPFLSLPTMRLSAPPPVQV